MMPSESCSCITRMNIQQVSLLQFNAVANEIVFFNTRIGAAAAAAAGCRAMQWALSSTLGLDTNWRAAQKMSSLQRGSGGTSAATCGPSGPECQLSKRCFLLPRNGNSHQGVFSLHHSICCRWTSPISVQIRTKESQHVRHWFYLNWLLEGPPVAFSVVPLNLLPSKFLTAAFTGLYANVLRSGGLSTILVAVPAYLLRSG